MLKLSALTDYGLILVTHLENGRFRTIQELATETHLPRATLAKLATKLEKGGILVSREGRSGGYALVRSRKNITLREVVEALEGKIAPVRCIAHPGLCDFEKDCSARPRWPQLTRDLVKWAESYTIADLIKQ